MPAGPDYSRCVRGEDFWLVVDAVWGGISGVRGDGWSSGGTGTIVECRVVVTFVDRRKRHGGDGSDHDPASVTLEL